MAQSGEPSSKITIGPLLFSENTLDQELEDNILASPIEVDLPTKATGETEISLPESHVPEQKSNTISRASRGDISSKITIGALLFPENSLYPEQKNNSLSVTIQSEYYHEWAGGHSFTLTPFARLDSADSKRSHFDIRELNFLFVHDQFELRTGIGKVFWGVTEFVHLIDIINQTDLVESINGEEKLGQPMAHLSIPGKLGVVDLFVLPWFRERTYPGKKGRLRGALPVDQDNAQYESGAEERHLDLAARYSHTLGAMDIGINHFVGTGREPTLLLSTNPIGEVTVIPFYEQINQTGLAVQFVAGQWLWKSETLYRDGRTEAFWATTGGFEYTLVNLMNTSMDLGIIGEFAYDGRGHSATTVYENDLMVGLRLAVNDQAGTALLLGLAQDWRNSSKIISVEAESRLSDTIKMFLKAGVFLNPVKDDLLYQIRNDNYIQFELVYYF